MDNEDIRELIMSDIEFDVKQLKNNCSVDKRARGICSKRSYWQNIFDKKSLVMPDFNYTTPEGWLLEFEKASVLKMDIDTILNVLENPQPEDFYGDNHPVDLGPLYVNGLPFNLIKLEELDLALLNKYWNRYLYDKCVHVDEYGNSLIPIPQIQITFVDKRYKVMFILYDDNDRDYHYKYKYVGDLEFIIKFLYLILSTGTIIYNATNNNIKLLYNTK